MTQSSSFQSQMLLQKETFIKPKRVIYILNARTFQGECFWLLLRTLAYKNTATISEKVYFKIQKEKL